MNEMRIQVKDLTKDVEFYERIGGIDIKMKAISDAKIVPKSGYNVWVCDAKHLDAPITVVLMEVVGQEEFGPKLYIDLSEL